jgi:hypothetical protein
MKDIKIILSDSIGFSKSQFCGNKNFKTMHDKEIKQFNNFLDGLIKKEKEKEVNLPKIIKAIFY